MFYTLNSNSFLSSHLLTHFTYSWVTTLDKRNQGHKNVSKKKHGPCPRGIYSAVWLLSHLESLQCSINSFFLLFYLLKNNLHTNFPNILSYFPPQPSTKNVKIASMFWLFLFFLRNFMHYCDLILFLILRKSTSPPSSISVSDTTVHTTV